MKRGAILLSTWLVCTGNGLAAVDVNTASVDQLQSVRGIGPVTAAKIVGARLKGPFIDADDLQGRVKGLGEKTVRRLAGAGLAIPSGSIRNAEPVGPELIVGRPTIEPAAVPPKACARPGVQPVSAATLPLWAPATQERPTTSRPRSRVRRST